MGATGAAPAPLFRAPHGFRSPFLVPVARRLGYRVVGWTAGVWDTAKPGIERIVDRSVSRLYPGAILLLHDADGSGNGDDRSQTVEALPRILEAGKEQGLQFVTISELAGELRPRRRMALRAMLVAAAVVCGVLILVHQARPEGAGRCDHRRQSHARVRGAGRKPGVGGRQGADLEGLAGRGRGHPRSR